MHYCITDERGDESIVSGDKFTLTSENHLVITSDDKPVAIFATGRWLSVQEVDQ